MPRPPSLPENLLRIVWLDFLWSLRVPQSLFYQFFVAAVLLVLLARVNDSPGYLEILVPGLIGLIAASHSMQGIGTTISYMRAYGAWRTIRSSPIPTSLYLSGLIVSRMVRVLMTVGFLLLVARLLLDYRFTGSLPLTFGYVVLGVAVFASLGLVVTYSIATPQAVTSVLSAVFLFMLFTSNALFIAKTQWLQALSWLSPLTYLSQLLRASARGEGLGAGSLLYLGPLVAWLLVLATTAFKLAQRRVEDA